MAAQQAVLPEGAPAGQAYFSALMHASAKTAQTFSSVPIRTSPSLSYLSKIMKLLLLSTSIATKELHPLSSE